jgi:U3 small nucleolar RNA-associated protein 5
MKIALETAHNLKMREPIVNREQVTALAPGAAGHSTNIQGKKPTKRKNDTIIADDKSAQPSMEDRLAILSFDESSKTADAVPTVRADSLSMLLSQGLQSNDSSILNQVLQQKNDKLIANTVKQLPIQAVMPLIKILNEKLDGTPEKCLIYIKWTRSVMLQHMSYLLTLPNVVPILGRMHQLISIRTKTHNRLSNLEGKLDLILTQVLIKESPQVDEASQEALIFFQEESSDEEDGFSFSDDDQQDDDWDNDFDFTDDGGGDEPPTTNGPQHLDENGEEEDEDEDEEMEEEEE